MLLTIMSKENVSFYVLQRQKLGSKPKVLTKESLSHCLLHW